jgi:hypothetical protein
MVIPEVRNLIIPEVLQPVNPGIFMTFGHRPEVQRVKENEQLKTREACDIPLVVPLQLLTRQQSSQEKCSNSIKNSFVKYLDCHTHNQSIESQE